ncbi:MAG TPA: arginine N-succinyltransferase [Polyangium sp.]|nr:arginine N-succinyltransferase [Polyangium sp.]
MVPFEIRAAVLGDEEQLLHVARHLNTVNLPNDRDEIHEIVSLSHRSFTGDIKDPRLRQYVFVLVERATEQIVGTSMIVSQLGRRGAPYIYFYDTRQQTRSTREVAAELARASASGEELVE